MPKKRKDDGEEEQMFIMPSGEIVGSSVVEQCDKLRSELECAKRDIAALLWLDGQCQYCKFGKKDEYSGANRWRCKLGSAANCRPEWRGAN